jgi:hypothetical protein
MANLLQGKTVPPSVESSEEAIIDFIVMPHESGCQARRRGLFQERGGGTTQHRVAVAPTADAPRALQHTLIGTFDHIGRNRRVCWRSSLVAVNTISEKYFGPTMPSIHHATRGFLFFSPSAKIKIGLPERRPGGARTNMSILFFMKNAFWFWLAGQVVTFLISEDLGALYFLISVTVLGYLLLF